MIPGQAKSQDVAAFHPVQRGSIFPLVLKHTRIAETGAGSELELIEEGRVGFADFDLRKRVGAARETDSKLARSVSLAGRRIGSHPGKAGALLPGQGRSENHGIVQRYHLAAGR